MDISNNIEFQYPKIYFSSAWSLRDISVLWRLRVKCFKRGSFIFFFFFKFTFAGTELFHKVHQKEIFVQCHRLGLVHVCNFPESPEHHPFSNGNTLRNYTTLSPHLHDDTLLFPLLDIFMRAISVWCKIVEFISIITTSPLVLVITLVGNCLYQ